MRNFSLVYFLMGLLACAVAMSPIACEKGQSRNSAAGEAPTETEDSDDDDDSSQIGGNSESLESCDGQSRAWLPIVRDGSGNKMPAACGDSLVSWCCSRDEILARFPTMKSQIEPILTQNIDTDGFVLYHCSSGGGDKTKVHFAKILNGGHTKYKDFEVEGVFPTNTGSEGGDCPKVTTDDLMVDGGGDDDDDDTSGDDDDDDDDAAPTPPTWEDINTILTTSCSGDQCHGNDVVAKCAGDDANSCRFVDNEENFMAAATDATLKSQHKDVVSRLESDDDGVKMPVPGEGKTIEAEDIEKIKAFIDQ